MSDNYLPGFTGYAHNGETGDTTQQNQLYKELLAQTMANSSGAGGMGGIAAHLLGTYAMMQGMNQQPYSTDPTSANFMGPPSTLAE